MLSTFNFEILKKMSSEEEKRAASANNASNAFHININTEKALPGVAQPAQSVQQPMQQPYGVQPTQYPPQYPGSPGTQ